MSHSYTYKLVFTQHHEEYIFTPNPIHKGDQIETDDHLYEVLNVRHVLNDKTIKGLSYTRVTLQKIK